jgi:hypothetical protein
MTDRGLLAPLQSATPQGLLQGPFGPQGSGPKLTKEEWNLYKHHLHNLAKVDKGGGFTQPDGSISTVLQRVVGPMKGGKFYNIPSVWDGKQLSQQESMQRAFGDYGLDYWPSYATPEEADARYIGYMHPIMERDMMRGKK